MKKASIGVNAACSLLLLAVALGCSGAAAAETGQGAAANELPSIILKALGTLPFSFVYGGKPSSEILPRWEQTRVWQTLPGNRERRVFTYRDRRTGLEIIDEITVYKTLQAADWVLRLRNTGSAFDMALKGLDSKARYEVTFFETYDVKEKRVMTGDALSKLRVQIGSAPGVMLVRYRKVKVS